jgi:hypothetical protein
MNIIRTVGFAAVAALSLGVGAAMAQGDGVDAGSAAGSPVQQYQPQVPRSSSARPAPTAVQSGSSDIEPAPVLPGNYYDVGTGGGSGG